MTQKTYWIFKKEIQLKINDTKFSNSTLKFYVKNPFKNEWDKAKESTTILLKNSL